MQLGRIFAVGALVISACPLFAQTAPDVTGPVTTFGILGTAQAETLGYRKTTAGFKVFSDVQYHPLVGFDVRGTAIRFIGSNHTYALEAGPRVERRYGSFTPYAEALVGGIHQYYYGATVGAAVGAETHVYQNVYLTGEGEYRYAPQKSTPLINPREGRIELSAGVAVRIGHQTEPFGSPAVR